MARLGLNGKNVFATAMATLLMLGCSQTATNTFVTDADNTMAQQARTAKNVYCNNGGFTGTLDRSTARTQLNQASGNNIVLQILQGANGTSALGSSAQSKLVNPNFILQAGSPIAGAIVMFIAWIFCCWSGCPCKLCFCRRYCCRCCQKQRETHVIIKIVGLLVLLGLIIGMIVCAALSYKGYQMVVDSVSNVGCTSATMVSSTFNGQVSPSFIGMLPLLNSLYNISTVLKQGSQFMIQMNLALDATTSITDAVTVATGTLQLMEDTLALSANRVPADQSSSLKHTCVFCEQLVNNLGPVVSSLENGIGAALSSARKTVMEQLGGSAAASVQGSIDNAASPLTQMKDQVKSSFGFFVTSDSYKNFKDLLVSGQVPLLGVACGLIIVLAICVALCAGCSCTCFTACEKTSKDGAVTYRRHPHRCALITWCCGFWYVMFALLIGGLITVIVVPTAGLCLTLDSMSSSQLNSIAGALGMNTSALTQVGMIVDQCFRNPDPSANVALLKLVNASSNQTMYDKLVSQVQGSITSAFSVVNTSSNQALMSASDVQTLILLIQTASVDLLINPTSSLVTSDTEFMAITANSVLNGKFLGSVRCADAPYSGNPIPGVESFRQALATLGTVAAGPPTPNCITNAGVECNGGSSETACRAGNNFVTLKQKLMTLPIFRCDLFEDSQGTLCDPYDMTGSQTTGYVNDCMKNGTMFNTKVINCDLTQFVTYVSKYSTRISKVLSRVDDATAYNQNKVTNVLYNLVDQYILSPILAIANGMTCGWMGMIYQQTLDGLCFQGVYGLKALADAYIACACFAVPIIPIMYLQWRRGVDNVNYGGVASEDIEKTIT